MLSSNPVVLEQSQKTAVSSAARATAAFLSPKPTTRRACGALQIQALQVWVRFWLRSALAMLAISPRRHWMKMLAVLNAVLDASAREIRAAIFALQDLTAIDQHLRFAVCAAYAPTEPLPWREARRREIALVTRGIQVQITRHARHVGWVTTSR